MNTRLKSCLLAVMAITSIQLTGCSTSLAPDSFNVQLGIEDTSGFWNGNSSATVLTIRSNAADPISMSNVSINKGQCGYTGFRRTVEFPQLFKMGQVLQLQLKGCGYNNVVQVDIETDHGSASYSFN